MKYSFDKEVKRFIDHINSLDSTLPLEMITIYATVEESVKKLNEFMERNNVSKIEKGTRKSAYRLKFEDLSQFHKLHNWYTNAKIASTIIPRNFIVSLVSQFDAYLGRLIKTIYFIKPELLTACEKNLTYAQINEFSTLEDVKEFIIEKEVESVLRKSHTEQFEWLKNKLDMPLTKGLDIWPTFIELTERRNLFVHCDGIISSQYIAVCKKNKVELGSDCKVGETLAVAPEYFENAYKCIFEVGVKLAHVIWRKLQAEDREKADLNINEICYDLIEGEKYDLSITLLEFATEFNKFSSEDKKLVLNINKAQAYKWAGNQEKCNEILNTFDWSAYSNDFKLAKAVLIEEYEIAAQMMKKIGSEGEVQKTDYRDWPIFKEFRKTDYFQQTYKEVFGESFEIIETEEREVNQPKKDVEGQAEIDNIFDKESAASNEESI